MFYADPKVFILLFQDDRQIKFTSEEDGHVIEPLLKVLIK